MLLLSALMIADRLVDVETESKLFKEKSEGLSVTKKQKSRVRTAEKFFAK